MVPGPRHGAEPSKVNGVTVAGVANASISTASRLSIQVSHVLLSSESS
jgi:hypothetical protein